jgi:hypothetical protein
MEKITNFIKAVDGILTGGYDEEVVQELHNEIIKHYKNTGDKKSGTDIKKLRKHLKELSVRCLLTELLEWRWVTWLNKK